VKKISNRNIADALKKLAEGVDRVIVATDYDREGELIGVEGLEILNKRPDIGRAAPSYHTKSAGHLAISQMWITILRNRQRQGR